MWMVRNPGGQHAQLLTKNRFVGIGWDLLGGEALTGETPADFYALIQRFYPEYKPQQVITAGRQVFNFVREMKIGDTVVTYDSPTRNYLVGRVIGPAVLQNHSDAESELFHIIRPVEWISEISRDSLSIHARNSLGSTLTVFRPSDDAEAELSKKKPVENEKGVAAATQDQVPVIDAPIEDPLANALENSKELIKDRLVKLSWQSMQELVAGILRAMGYKTKVSPEGGGDRGKDIVASPDSLGLEHPRIFVEVKHRKGAMGSAEVRRFIGGRSAAHDRCVFVSTGGFTTEAKYEAERSSIPLTLVDNDELVDLILEYYDGCDAQTRALIPLRKIYWPS